MVNLNQILSPGEGSSVLGSLDVLSLVGNESLEFSGVSVLDPSILNGFEVHLKVSGELAESLLDDDEDFSDDGDFFDSGVGGVDEFRSELSAHCFGRSLESVVSGELAVGGGDDFSLIDDALLHSSDLLLGSLDVLLEGGNSLLKSGLELLESDDGVSLDLLVGGPVALDSGEEVVQGGLELGGDGLVGVVGVGVLGGAFFGGGEGDEDGDGFSEETQLSGVSQELLGLLDEGESLEGSLELVGDVLDEVLDEGDGLFEVSLSDEVHLVFSVSLLDGLLELGLVGSEGGDEFGEVLSGGLEGGSAESSGGSGLAQGGLGIGDFLVSEGGLFLALLHHSVGDLLMFGLLGLELGHHSSDVLEEGLDGLGAFGSLDLD